jgi:hypothetical protein
MATPARSRSGKKVSSSKKPAEKPRGHRPQHEPTRQTTATVTVMVAAGIEQDVIAECVGVSPKTLRLHYKRELATAYAVIKAEIAGGLINTARGVKANPEKGIKGVPGDLKAQMFYLETHGWVRSERLLVKDDGVTDDADPSALTDAQITERLAKLRRSAAVTRARRVR